MAVDDMTPAASSPVEFHAGSGAWTEAGAYQVHPGIFRIPLPLPDDGLRAVNVYALEQSDGLVLIDSGWALTATTDHLERALGQIGHDLADIRRVLVTHIHPDHYTHAVQLRRLVGSRVSLGVGERPSLELLGRSEASSSASWGVILRRAGARALSDLIMGHVPRAAFDTRVWEPPDEWLGPGKIELDGRTLQVVPTPGHTRGHVVYLDAEAGLLFAGDHVLPHITPSIGFEVARADLPLGDYLDSLHLVSTFPDARLLPAHGPVGDSVHSRVGALLAHHAERLDQSEAIVQAEASDGFTVAQRLTWTRRRTPFGDLDLFNQMLAVTETMAHLDLLVVRGRLESAVDDGVTIYRGSSGA